MSLGELAMYVSPTVMAILLAVVGAKYQGAKSALNTNSVTPCIIRTEANVNSVAWLEDSKGQHIFSGDVSLNVALWNAATQQNEATIKADPLNTLAMAALRSDGKQFAAAASSDFSIYLRNWDLFGGHWNKLQGHTRAVHAVAYSPDGLSLASASDDGTIRVWNTSSGSCKQTLSGHVSWVRSVAFSPDGLRVASGGDDKTIRVWNVESGKQIGVLINHTSMVTAVAWSGNGQFLASGATDGAVCVWSVDQMALLQPYPNPGLSHVNVVAYSPDTFSLAAGGQNGKIRMWFATSGGDIKTLSGHTGPVMSLAYSPDGKYLTSGGWDQTVRVWDAPPRPNEEVFL